MSFLLGAINWFDFGPANATTVIVPAGKNYVIDAVFINEAGIQTTAVNSGPQFSFQDTAGVAQLGWVTLFNAAGVYNIQSNRYFWTWPKGNVITRGRGLQVNRQLNANVTYYIGDCSIWGSELP